MKKLPFIKLVVLTFVVLLSNCQNNLEEQEAVLKLGKGKLSSRGVAKKKVLLLGIDGLQFEKMVNVFTPNLDEFNIVKAYTGGIKGAISEQKTNSGPGWTTILTGVWANKHRVLDNNSSFKSATKSIFQRIKEHNPNLETTSIVTWKTIHDFLREQLNYIDYKIEGYGDDKAIMNAVNEINNHNPDFLFIDIDEPDSVGHGNGFGGLYNNAIKRADERLGTLVAAVKNRAKERNEDWLIILTTDHGRQPSGYGHGSQSNSEKTIFIGMNKIGNEEFTSYTSSVPNKGFNGLYGHVSQTSIVPTILTHLEIPIKKEWQLSSTSLIGNVGARKVMMENNNTIYWDSNSLGSIEVYRNNEYINSVNASQGYFLDNDQPDGLLNYTLVLNGQTATTTINNLTITAGLDWNDGLNNKAYFFRGDNKYVRYNKILDKADNGYPVEIDNSNWPGLESYKNLISAAFKWNSSKCIFFLKDGRYIRYDMNSDSIDSGYPLEINNSNWPGLEAHKNKIRAAFKWNNKKAYFFLNDGTYLRYSIANDRVDSGYPKPINNTTWPGLGSVASKITAAVNWNSVHCYLFLNDNTYVKYSKTLDRAELNYPRPTNNRTWPGLLK
ncbi:hypothetical protein CXF68_13445 [Tenacibaculum sp. Bg11-29]|uniref:hemopexin repeat-containing protein n=1 Tax=Tenacibaculum sp. Bg11-29 TaxID=2058306 RepID=UPI000C34881E|nr:hemopexin repeat-containing protein [Tenacibaculum sp. Bg11-29]PKH51623.1 hypothetical protein CXF68_13445 [Tenacibaculum sp. Bg11-29]